MIKHNQDGAANGLVISLVMALLLLVAALGVAGWAISGRQDYKNNSDQKVAKAVAIAKQEESISKDKQFAEEYKKPLDIYRGPDAYGSLSVAYPKTWSGYVADKGSGSNLVDGFFAPGVVPSATDQTSVFALRVTVQNKSYAEAIKSYQSQQQTGKLKAEAYALPKVPKVVGLKLTGELSDKKVVTMIVLPLRSQTLQIWTEGTQYVNDFDTYIIPNFSFSP